MECDCGHRDVAEDAEALVALARAHARRDHGMELPVEYVLVMAVPVDAPGGGEE